MEAPDEEKQNSSNRVSKAYKVIAIYPYHVLAVNKLGLRRSFSYGDLITMGIEKQSPDIEARRNAPVGWVRKDARG